MANTELLTAHPDRAIRRQAQAQQHADEGGKGGTGILLIVAGIGGFAIYELLKKKPAATPQGLTPPTSVVLDVPSNVVSGVRPADFGSLPGWTDYLWVQSGNVTQLVIAPDGTQLVGTPQLGLGATVTGVAYSGAGASSTMQISFLGTDGITHTLTWVQGAGAGSGWALA